MTVFSVSIIGAGNVGFHLNKAFTEAGIKVEQICNRSAKSVDHLIAISGAEYIKRPEKLREVDIILLAVSDKAITSLSKRIPKYTRAIIAHTSGSVSVDVLAHYSNFGVFYPLQSFRKERNLNYSQIPVFVSAPTDSTKSTLFELAKCISESPIIIDDSQRSKLHIPAVMVNNFTNHLFARAKDLCDDHDLDFNLLIPLINETVARLSSGRHPAKYQTGPAKRNDMKTIENHRATLQTDKKLLELYNLMTREIQGYKK